MNFPRVEDFREEFLYTFFRFKQVLMKIRQVILLLNYFSKVFE